MSVQIINKVGYGLSEALPRISPLPIPARRNPTTADKAPIGQTWINVLTNSAFILTSIVNNASNWLSMGGAGGPGAFTTLTSTGQTTLNTAGAGTNAIGNSNAASFTTITGGNASLAVAQGGLVFSGPSISVFGGNTTYNNGCNVIIAGTNNYLSVNSARLLAGAGVPSNALATAVGFLYINTTATTAATRVYISTAVNTWTNLTAVA